ncbi:MauE/DoxX family redox-associated membrane protein [Algoriphagus taiwanensis]|uniref:Methylamine utilisation protein MauE domain-containing protein n=1 Tax=Algoriphagus taiwanensis TaxID=1445656 RepID=A0ABQ6Q6N3_9BACT|nr:hypothetical protein Ataiwa_37940 [Algoriphagus taiwanensis]
MNLKIQNVRKTKVNTQWILSEASGLLIAFVFTYTAIAKIYDWQATRLAMYNQVIPDWSKDLLLYGIPLIELIVAFMLLIPNWRKIGFLASLILMLIFTGYVAWVWFGLAGRVPCSCGGIISSLTWGQHFVLNLGLIGISVLGLKLEVGKYGRVGSRSFQ